MSTARSEYAYRSAVSAPTIPNRLHVVRDGEHPDVAGTLPAVVGAGLRVTTLTGEIDYANLDH
ncbi:MAG: hypothetical protein ABIW80_02585, partial [Lapillicoccus sp.]